MSQTVKCDFCYHECVIPEGGIGLCGVRECKEGRIQTLGYGVVVATAMDPIEKKPFYHVYPGKKTLSFALFGCNFTCSFCQNHRISQKDSVLYPRQSNRGKPPLQTTPQELANTLLASRAPIMSYTYSEPIVWQDYMLETARLVHQAGLINCMVTNGSFSPSSLERVLPFIDAFNIDVKGDDGFYREYCGGRLEPVLQGIRTICTIPDKILEVTTLVIEGIHTPEMLQKLGHELKQAGVQVWHLSRFFPHYRMESVPATSEEFLLEALLIAKDSGIPYIYAGNSGLTEWDRTICPSCGKTLINSHSYFGEASWESTIHIQDGRCVYCGSPIYGLFPIK
jgi:pyruvate formate lyase activating enzyme